MRHPLPASSPSPAADLDPEAHPQLRPHLGVVDAFRQPHRRQLRQPPLEGEGPKSQVGQRVLQQSAGLAVAGMGRVESFVEHDAQAGVQSVQHRDGRGVVITPREPT